MQCRKHEACICLRYNATVVKSNQWPSSIYKWQCITQWQLCMGKQLQALGGATSKVHDLNVPRIAMMQPHKPQTACQQVHEETTDTTMIHHKHGEPIVPADNSHDPPDTPPEEGARHRAGEGVCYGSIHLTSF